MTKALTTTTIERARKETNFSWKVIKSNPVLYTRGLAFSFEVICYLNSKETQFLKRSIGLSLLKYQNLIGVRKEKQKKLEVVKE